MQESRSKLIVPSLNQGQLGELTGKVMAQELHQEWGQEFLYHTHPMDQQVSTHCKIEQHWLWMHESKAKNEWKSATTKRHCTGYYLQLLSLF